MGRSRVWSGAVRMARLRPVARVTPALLIAPGLLLASCQYLQDRALDFLDQYKGSVGAGPMGGVRSKNLGVVDTGLMVGAKPRALALGWRYGTPLYFKESDSRFDVNQAEIVKTTTLTAFDYEKGSYKSAKTSAVLFPAIFSWIDSTPTDYEWYVPEEAADYDDRHWIWSGRSFYGNSRFDQIHAFDIEVEVGLFVYVEVGFSPGEIVDFLLGFLTIDIAGDDGRL